MKMDTYRREAGFSMPELLVVLVAAMIIMASAVPFVDLIIDQFNLTLTAQGLANQMQYARMRAVSSNEAFRLRFLPGTNSYQVETENGVIHTGPIRFPPGVNLNPEGGDPVSFPGDEVLFLPSGTLPLTGIGSAGRVRLINPQGLRIDVIVDSGGLVRQTPTYKDPSSPY